MKSKKLLLHLFSSVFLLWFFFFFLMNSKAFTWWKAKMYSVYISAARWPAIALLLTGLDGWEPGVATQTLQRPESSDGTGKPDLATGHLHLQHVRHFVTEMSAVVETDRSVLVENNGSLLIQTRWMWLLFKRNFYFRKSSKRHRCWCLFTLCLLACEVRVTVGSSSLWGVVWRSSQWWLAPSVSSLVLIMTVAIIPLVHGSWYCSWGVTAPPTVKQLWLTLPRSQQSSVLTAGCNCVC